MTIESKNGYFKYFYKTQVNKRVAGNFERLSKSKNDCLPTLYSIKKVLIRASNNVFFYKN